MFFFTGPGLGFRVEGLGFGVWGSMFSSSSAQKLKLKDLRRSPGKKANPAPFQGLGFRVPSIKTFSTETNITQPRWGIAGIGWLGVTLSLSFWELLDQKPPKPLKPKPLTPKPPCPSLEAVALKPTSQHLGRSRTDGFRV